MNFEKHFGSHYAKIGQYIENEKKAANMEQSIETEEIVRCKTGFFIEEEFPPILDINGTLREVRYMETKQFLDFFRDKIKVDFILFGTQYTADRDTAFDLRNGNINIANINKNEHIPFLRETVKLAVCCIFI